MLFSNELKKTIDADFEEVLKLIEYKKQEIQRGLDQCKEIEQYCIKFLYTCMPLSDMANYSFDIYLSYVRHGLFLKENMPWGEKIPANIFLKYVMFYRINNENIEDCRRTFYNNLIDRIKDKDMPEAVIEVNYWCLEQATYQTTDERTASPLTVLRSAYGRCGEESTFTVTALRSVGIPARQVYVPRWSHCDDNHAWVEVWCDGKWNYLGACEPEPSLNIGWFTAAASRAMLINSRIFTSMNNVNQIVDEELISKNDKAALVNSIENYADTKKLVVKILNSNNKPMDKVKVRFEVLNYSEFYPVATVITNNDGIAGVTLGLGDIYIHAVKDNRFINKLVDTRNQDEIVLSWNDSIIEEVVVEDIDIVPPIDNMKYAISLTDSEKESGKKRFAKCNDKRKQKESNFITHDDVSKLMNENNYKDDALKDIFIKSKGNYQEIKAFIDSKLKCSIDDKIMLLTSLSNKDYTDITNNILKEHLIYSMEYKSNYPEEIFQNYIINPRVHFEMITNYRKSILDYFDVDTKNRFIEHPTSIWDYIDTYITELPKLEYNPLSTNPVDLLKLKKGNSMSKKILFVAICRTLGIPARIDKENLELQYYTEDRFINVNHILQKSLIKLTLINEDNTNWKYWLNFTIAKLNNGVYETLDLVDREWVNDKLTLELEPGNYRIITSNRMPNGSIFSKKYCFILFVEKELGLSLRQGKLEDMFKNIEINNFKLTDKDNNKIIASNILGDKKNIIIWIEEGKEPTEHVLNEMLEHQDILNKLPCNIIFVLRNKEALTNATLNNTLKVYPNIQIYYDESAANASPIARRVYVDPDKLPLILLTNKGLNVVYAFSGYNVGLSDLIIKIIEAI
ncbi:transglutaminase domain-containing protein [Vallitalea guaymasensis]|uniref:transglutaminase domain-containing protein n=1 Tax=Vallitalea guaymasensis TaxID=1185412 RepID=UPI0023550DE5|nr:transglutaminase-like domain-containing protein [Vallitalea guaymasensis]